MDNTETHYVSFDPEAIYRAMLAAYIENGGDLIYPGDEKEMLLRTVQSVIVQGLASVDNALRMATLTYAEGAFLDLYGQQRNCARIEAEKAKAVIEVAFGAYGTTATIPAGAELTADGTVIYVTDDEIIYNGSRETYQVGITARDAGSAGNALTENTRMQFLDVVQYLSENPKCVSAAAGGTDRETDAAYRERIRNHTLADKPSGGKAYYEDAARKASPAVIDAEAIAGNAGAVNIYLLIDKEATAQTVISAVQEAAAEIRLLNDTINVQSAIKKIYTLHVKYTAPAGANVAAGVAKAVSEYIAWQDTEIGRAFNPDRLLALLYQAGCDRAYFDTGSNFNGGAVQYTEIGANEYCDGKITIGDW